MSEKRNIIKREIASLDIDGISFEDAILMLQREHLFYKETYPEYTSFVLEQVYVPGREFDDERMLYVCGIREETDAEMQARAKSQEIAKTLRRQRYEELHKEFGDYDGKIGGS